MIHHAYWAGLLFFISTCLLYLLMKKNVFRQKVSETGVIFLVLCNALAVIYFVFKRPAGSTIFESFNFFLCLSAILLTVIPEAKTKRWYIFSACILWVGVSIGTFNWNDSFAMVKFSKEKSAAKWEHYHYVRNLADGRQITVLFPDNSYHHEGVFEFLLKGAADFPTWNISDGGQRVIDKYLPGLKFRHDYGGASPNQAYNQNTVVVWYDLPGDVSLVEKYPSLANAVEKSVLPTKKWRLEGKVSGAYVNAWASLLVSSPPKI